MALFLGNTQVFGVATGDAATTENLNSEISTQDELIAQIMASLEGKMVPSGGGGSTGGGSEVIVSSMTTTSVNPSITIQDAAGKDNVALMYMTSGNYQASAMADAGLGNVVVHGDSYSYTILYSDSMYSDSDDGFIKYDKATGTISLNNNMRYNETFVAGTYMYVVW